MLPHELTITKFSFDFYMTVQGFASILLTPRIGQLSSPENCTFYDDPTPNSTPKSMIVISSGWPNKALIHA